MLKRVGIFTVRAARIAAIVLGAVVVTACSRDDGAPVSPSGPCAALEQTWWSARLNQSPQVLLSPDGNQMAWRRVTVTGAAHWCVGPAGRPEEARRYDLSAPDASWTPASGLVIGIQTPTRLEGLTEPRVRGFAEFVSAALDGDQAVRGQRSRGWRFGALPQSAGLWVSTAHQTASDETLYFQNAPGDAPLLSLPVPGHAEIKSVTPLPEGALAVETLIQPHPGAPMMRMVHSPHGDAVELGEFEMPGLDLAGWADPDSVFVIDHRADFPRLQRLSLRSGGLEPVAGFEEIPAHDPVLSHDGALLAIHDDAVRPRPVGIDAAVAAGLALIEAEHLAAPDDLSLRLITASASGGRALFRRADSAGRVVYILTDRDAQTAAAFDFAPEAAPLQQLYETVLFDAVSADGGLVPAILHLPEGLDGTAPLAVILHGGPTAHDRAEAADDREALLRRGLPVLVVNYRGSTGYGRAHLEAGWGAFDSGMVEDVSAAVDDALARIGQRRVLMTGASFGAHLAFAAARAEPETVCAVVAINPAGDLLGFQQRAWRRQHAGVLAYWERLYGRWYEPDGAARLQAASAVTRPGDWTLPVAVIASEHDTVTPAAIAQVLAEVYEDVLFAPYTVIEGAGHSPDAHQFVPVLEDIAAAALSGPCAP